MLERFETSELFDDDLKRDLRTFREDLDRINDEKGAAVAALLGVQQRMARYSETIATNLAELVALGDQRRALDGVLDVETRRYLQGIRQRAKERLHAYLYEFVKSYQYHYLRDVSDTFYNFDAWVAKLRELESVDEHGTVTPVPLSAVQEIERQVTRNEYLGMAREIVVQRQREAGASRNSYVCTLSDEQRDVLCRTGYLRFNVLEDFNTHADLGMRNARIADVALRQFDVTLAPGADGVNLHVDVEHSGRSILLDGDGRYWFFQKGRHDDPIRWRYVWKGDGLPVRDTPIEDGEFLDELLSDSNIEYREYLPALFSDLTLWINKGTDPEARTRDLASIDALQFELAFVRH